MHNSDIWISAVLHHTEDVTYLVSYCRLDTDEFILGILKTIKALKMAFEPMLYSFLPCIVNVGNAI